MKKLEVKYLILNEREVIEQVINGSKIPDYWTTKEIFRKICDYYMKYKGITDVDFISKQIMSILKRNKIHFKKATVVQEVQSYDLTKGKYELMDFQEPVKIYQSEVDAINKLSLESTKKIAFAMLVIQKIEIIKYKRGLETQPYLNKEIGAFFVYSDTTNGSKKIDILHELHQQGIITVPLIDRGLYVNILAHEGEVVYEIKDGFESSKEHYDKCFDTRENKIYLEIDANTGEYDVHHGFLSVNPKRKERGAKVVKSSHINRCIAFDSITAGGSYWVEITDEIAKSEDKIQAIREKLVQIGFSYSKLKKQIGVEGIKKDFDQFMDSLKGNPELI